MKTFDKNAESLAQTSLPEPQSPPVRLALIVGSPLTADFFIGELTFFKSAGFEVTVIAPPGEQLDRVTAQEQAGKITVPMAREIEPLADLRALWQLWLALRRLRPTVMDCSDPKAALLASIAGFLARVPCRVYTMRGLRLETTTGLKRKVLEWAERISCALAHRVICNSRSLRQRAIDLGLVGPRKALVLGNGSRGIDQARFAPTAERVRNGTILRDSLGIPAGVPVVGFAGRLVRDKGVVELVNAYQTLRSEFCDLRLLLIGDYEPGDPIPPAIRKIIEGDPHIIRTGHIRDVSDYYQAMNVLALPTYREGFPSVVLEAQSAGKPVVTTFATGAIDSVVDGETGLLVPVAKVPALAGALRAILRDPNYAARLGTAGRERVLRDFGHKFLWSRLVEEYEQIMLNTGQSRSSAPSSGRSTVAAAHLS